MVPRDRQREEMAAAIVLGYGGMVVERLAANLLASAA